MRAAVLGSPVRHSLSPALHRAAYQALGLDWTYRAIEMSPDGLAAFLDDLDADWAGLSLTMPLKGAALPLMDALSRVARQTGSVNTVLLGPEGRHGDNTDVYGIVAALREAGVTTVERGVVLGGGATARSAIAALATLGERAPRVAARSASTGLLDAAARLGLALDVVPLCPDAFDSCDVMISTLPPHVADAFSGQAHRVPVLLDVVYRPWPTALAAGCAGVTVPGDLMLLHQAAEQVRLMTGRPAPLDAMRAVLKASVG
ncbi:MAG: shikimate dehydrogenase [Actinomycetota bacterium]|nr:shikimate dehydrogenase [Actinomycetota bacterium]